MDTSPHASNFVNVDGIRMHYLDWGGDGDVLLFLAGMGCSVHIFDEFAPRFTDKFRVLAMDRRGHGDSDYPESGYDQDSLTEDLRQFLDALKIDKAILVGHSLAYIELSRFAILYPEHVQKLIFLDAAYDNSSPECKAVFEKNPLPKIMPGWPEDFSGTIEDYIAEIRMRFPALAAIWCDTMDEQTRHTVEITPDGRVVDKMSEAEFNALTHTINNYAPEYSKIQSPILGFFALQDGSTFLSPDYMTEEQKTLVMEYFRTTRLPYTRHYIEQLRQEIPHANVVEIPQGHHYCFIKHEELVYEEMRKFLLV